jgi:dGTPase
MESEKPKSRSTGRAAAKDRGIPLYRRGDFARPVAIGDRPDLPPEQYRSEFRRDYARIIHCPAFRRLQGKAQLFPCQENDFFRNRLTHSLEVAQIAKSIAIRLNDINPYFNDHPINTDLVEFAGLAHDLGHPPFGHNGEFELDLQMLEHGGFEGNAQTLRILSRVEKKQTTTFPHDENSVPAQVVENVDVRAGLNLTFRSLASIIKYDRAIPANEDARKKTKTETEPVKGFYQDEAQLVAQIRQNIVGPDYQDRFNTIECSIMDIADDIAYSTYDLEDAFKGRFLTPLGILAMSDEFKARIVSQVQAKLNTIYGHLSLEERTFTLDDYNQNLRNIFAGVLGVDSRAFPEGPISFEDYNAIAISIMSGTSDGLCKNGYYRTEFTSEWVGRFIRAVDVVINEKAPCMSQARLSVEAFVAVEMLKKLSFEAVIMSPRLKSAENRGKWIVEQIYKELTEDNGYLLMPDDWRSLVEAREGDTRWKRRMTCDFIAGMTDAYCIEYYERILGRAGPSIQKEF